MQCTAKSKRSGQQCRRFAVIGMDKCMMHGGKTPRGIASPRFKTGRYSRHLPVELAALYKRALTDADLLSLRDDLALLQARLCQLLESGESRSLWSAATSAWEEVKAAFRAGQVEAMQAALDELDVIMSRGSADTTRWIEVYDVLGQLRRTRESESRRMVELQQMIRADEAMLLVTTMLSAVKENVTDRQALSAIGNSFLRLIGPIRGQSVIEAGDDS
jgi:hypothetical protein